MRVAGTPEAKRAWLMLRGSYFLAYVTLVLIAFSIVPQTSVGWIWKLGLIISGTCAALGSFASWLIVGPGKTMRWLVPMEALEVTGLRVMTALQFVYSVSVIFLLHPSWAYVALNLCIGFFALGILLNMTWHKKGMRSGQ